MLYWAIMLLESPRQREHLTQCTAFSQSLRAAVTEVSGGSEGEEFIRKMMGRCQESSHALIYFLLQSPTIANVAVLACHNMPNEYTTGWLSHYGVLAQDVDGEWYASSPANYCTVDLAEKMHTGTLEEVLNSYTRQERGLWIDAAFVHEVLAEGVYMSEAAVRPDGAAHIQTVCLETDGRYYGSSFFQRARSYVFDVGPARRG